MRALTGTSERSDVPDDKLMDQVESAMRFRSIFWHMARSKYVSTRLSAHLTTQRRFTQHQPLDPPILDPLDHPLPIGQLEPQHAPGVTRQLAFPDLLVFRVLVVHPTNPACAIQHIATLLEDRLELECRGGDLGEGDELQERRLGEEMDVVCLSRDKPGGEGGVREIGMEVLLDLTVISGMKTFGRRKRTVSRLVAERTTASGVASCPWSSRSCTHACTQACAVSTSTSSEWLQPHRIHPRRGVLAPDGSEDGRDIHHDSTVDTAVTSWSMMV